MIKKVFNPTNHRARALRDPPMARSAPIPRGDVSLFEV
jgi:hypothetical protein